MESVRRGLCDGNYHEGVARCNVTGGRSGDKKDRREIGRWKVHEK